MRALSIVIEVSSPLVARRDHRCAKVVPLKRTESPEQSIDRSAGGRILRRPGGATIAGIEPEDRGAAMLKRPAHLPSFPPATQCVVGLTRERQCERVSGDIRPPLPTLLPERGEGEKNLQLSDSTPKGQTARRGSAGPQRASGPPDRHAASVLPLPAAGCSAALPGARESFD